MHRFLQSVLTLALSMTCVSGSIALADGIQSRGKIRMPQTMVQKKSAGRHSLPQKSVLVPSVTTDESIIAMHVKRTARLRQRKERNTQQHSMKEFMKESNSNPARRIDRLKLIKRGMGTQPIECKILHTHERARCQRDALLLRDSRGMRVAIAQ